MMRSIKILFLDFDDVLNTAETLGRGELFAKPNVQALNAIVDRTDVNIVVTSTWRIGATPAELEELLVEAGIHASGRVIGITPCLDESPRGEEILAWLEQAPVKVDDFVILDDREDMGDFIPHLVKTDPRFGLIQDQVQDVLSRLIN